MKHLKLFEDFHEEDDLDPYDAAGAPSSNSRTIGGYNDIDDVEEDAEEDYWRSEEVRIDLEEQLEKELERVDKYRDFVDKGTFPEDEFNDSEEFYEDLKRTEDHIKDLKKQLKELKKGVKEGIFNTGIFNRGVMDFTKPMTSASTSRSRWWKRRRQETPKKIAPRPYYGVEEEEEEEQPYKKSTTRKPSKSNTKTKMSDEYWSDENVKKRQERNKRK